MDLGLGGRTAIVAASSKGLGRASALALAREGAQVTVCARNGVDLASAAEEIRAETRAEVLAVEADLSTAAGVERVVAATVERFGGVDILVANSGAPSPGKLAQLTDEDWLQGFELVALGFIRFVREVVPQMRERRWGRIVAIQSSSVKEALEHLDLSNGIRPGVAGLMKALVPDLARDGITINLVLPGTIRTARIHPGFASADAKGRALAEEQVAPLVAQIPLGRLGEPIEVGNLVAFLASEQASYITGAVYQVDGGKIRSNV